jgi:flagellar basal body rod protein FlgG
LSIIYYGVTSKETYPETLGVLMQTNYKYTSALAYSQCNDKLFFYVENADGETYYINEKGEELILE